MSEPDACPYMCHCHGNMDVDIFAVRYNRLNATPTGTSTKVKKERSELHADDTPIL